MPLEAAALTVSAVGLAFTVAQTILAALQCQELKDLFGSDLESLERTVETIQAALRDAESMQANGIKLSAQQRNFIEQIKYAVYDADDLLDAYVTRAKLQQINMESGHKLSAKVRAICSRFKHLAIASPKAKKIVKKLEMMGRDAQNFKFDSPTIRRIRKETCSDLNENRIVGREDDQRRIVETLLHPIIQGDLHVLAIVGVVGLGKTALAQLVYNDHRIQDEFSLMLWVCVSDEGGNEFNRKAILAKIYKLATGEKSIGDMELHPIVQKLRSELDQHKYLLVLDDLWNEDRDECRELVDILIGSIKRGSRILVTTRSKKTASAIGNIRPYELHGLSEDNSWLLFEMKVERKIREGHDLFEICKDIVKKCVNVPLAIKVVGSLLYDVPENEWQSFRESRLLEIKKDDNGNGIIQILKFSYYHLSPSQKSCFTYCALFPKDFEIQKENLISMWMAHGYVKDDVEAEYHFQILVQRCFFQDIKEHYNGDIRFKIHDLMHDMAQEVAGKGIYVANSSTTKLDKKIRHLYDGAPASRTKVFVTPAKIRTYVPSGSNYERSASNIQLHVSRVLTKWRQLRVLDLHNFGIRQLPDAIGELLHLRYLDLSENRELEKLPDALTKLINLQFLNVDCAIYGNSSSLKKLPRDLKKLTNLRTLYVPESVEYMPLGMESLTGLTRLNRFIVGGRKSCVKQEDKLKDLRGRLRNLKGSLEIRFKEDYRQAEEYRGGGGYVCNTQHLHSFSIVWDFERTEEWRVGNDEHLLEVLQPHRNLKELGIICYLGVRISSWAREDSLTTSLPNLVHIHLWNCDGLEELPWLGRLQHLKILWLHYLKNVEYVENRRSIGVGSSSDDGGVASNSSTLMLFFPSLEELDLFEMPKLKGWWRESSIVNNGNDISMLTTTLAHPLPSFPRLSTLYIKRCPNLTSIPLCPTVKTLKLSSRFGARVIEEEGEKREEEEEGNSSGNVVENSTSPFIKAGLPMLAFQCLVDMEITEDSEMESVSEYEEVFRSCSSSLKSLSLISCSKLRSVCQGGLEYLTALELLSLSFLPELEFEEEMPWRSLGQSLRSLILLSLKKVDSLPKGMRYLTALQSLAISEVPLLKEIPEWIGCLSSLLYLTLEDCVSLESLPREMKNLTSLKEFQLIECSEELHGRCEKPDGEYWGPILQHIPTLVERNFSEEHRKRNRDRKIARERDRELYPPEIKHALHHHSLKLNHHIRACDTCVCDACDKRIHSGPRYSCSACDFDLDLNCAGISEITVPYQQESPISMKEIPEWIESLPTLV